jgi:hypothetical protein
MIMSHYVFAAPKKRRVARTTWTTQIMGLLCRRDDLISTSDIVAAVKCTTSQALAALSHMHKYKAVDMVMDNGKTYWFATPGNDCRHYSVDERKEEEPGSRAPRKKKVKP